ncbi:MAG: antibiotic biosynthesis monooxygenase [Gammaproteobacteria bacterium]|nr:antibiotic biosynthesis monooxygenase [Gammaproteobacteria bacterium]
MVTKALYARLKAKPGKEPDVEAFLADGLPLAQGEEGTISWYAIKQDDSTYAIFDTFEDEAGREAHLNGDIAAALKEKADELFAEPPVISKIDILGAKQPD